jgi:hypothetical protein
MAMSARNLARMAAALACAACGLASVLTVLHADVSYPLKLTADASVKSGVTTVTSKVTIRVDRAMEDNRRKRVTDALAYGGYANFLNTLRPLPPVGAIETQSKMVDIKYTREEPDGDGRRLILVADRPLFFLGETKPRAGYELTVVDLRIDAKGAVTGTMAGAARVKPSPSGVVLDNYTDAPVQLVAHVSAP